MPYLTDAQYKQLEEYCGKHGYYIKTNNTISYDYEITTTLSDSILNVLVSTENVPPIPPKILLSIHNKTKNRYLMKSYDWRYHSKYIRSVCDTFDELLISIDNHIKGIDKSLNILFEEYRQIKYAYEMLELQLEKSAQVQLAVDIISKKFSEAEISKHKFSKPCPRIEYRWNIGKGLDEKLVCEIIFTKDDFKMFNISSATINYDDSESTIKSKMEKAFNWRSKGDSPTA